MLEQAGAPLDFAAAVNLERYDLAEAMLREDPRASSPPGVMPSRCTLRSAGRTWTRCAG